MAAKPTDQHQKSRDVVWTRSKIRNEDQLRLFLKGDLYDCSFKVGTAANKMKVFKCHKLILSIASGVFQVMFYGNFKEASKGPDDPIIFEDIDHDAFELVMRFVYGDEVAFDNIPLAIQVYKFAHKMQITSVLSPVEEFLDREMDAANALAIYDLYNSTENMANTDRFLKILLSETEEALSSEGWLKVTADTVNAVLQMELAMEELDIFKSLIRWGEAQVLKDGSSSRDEALLRKKVDPFLKLIRFESLAPSLAAELCSSTTVLSSDEKNGILLTSILRDMQHLSSKFAVAEKRPARTRNLLIEVVYNRLGEESSSKKAAYLNFTVIEDLDLVGLEISKDFIFPPDECNLKLIGEGVTYRFVHKRGRFFTPNKGICPLSPIELYTFTISKRNSSARHLFPLYTLDMTGCPKKEHETVAFPQRTCVPLSKLYFR